MADEDMTTPGAETPPFDHAAHPRHATSGQFVGRDDVDQAMRRIHDGRQTSRTALPQPTTPDHPA